MHWSTYALLAGALTGSDQLIRVLRSISEPDIMSKSKNFRRKLKKFLEGQEVDKEFEDGIMKFIEEEVLDKMVEDGIFRVVGIDGEGLKIYESTEAGQSPHLIADPPKRMQ